MCGHCMHDIHIEEKLCCKNSLVLPIEKFNGFDGFDGFDGFNGFDGFDGFYGFDEFYGFNGFDGFDGFNGFDCITKSQAFNVCLNKDVLEAAIGA